MRNDDPTKFERADPNALADFDPRTKVCTMNCGPTVGDHRSPDERRFLCPDCVTVPATSGNRANDLFAALLEFHNAFCNRDETTSLHVWNERMKAADENAVAVLNAAPPSASQPDTVAVPIHQLEHWAEYWNGNANEKSMTDALEHILDEIDAVLQAAQEAK